MIYLISPKSDKAPFKNFIVLLASEGLKIFCSQEKTILVHWKEI
jgi:hypothetical protein